MPYIKQERRERIDLLISKLSSELIGMNWTAGDLNYVIFRLMVFLFHWKPGYQTVNDFRGALACTWDEFYRRVAAPYEDKKILENGDVL